MYDEKSEPAISNSMNSCKLPGFSRRQFVGSLAAAAALIGMPFGRPASLAPDRSIPLSEKEIGHLRHFSELANLPAGDWSGMGDGAMGWLGVPERTFRYQIAKMAYAVASVQYDRTPAYREFYQQTLRALIDRLQEPDCWREWANVSRGGGHADHGQPMGPGEFDPIKRYNIMYGGHLLQCICLYESLYAEDVFTKPGSIRLEWQERNWGPGPQVFEYDIQKIVDGFVRQLEELNYEGFPCEPNMTFPECPQHAVLGLMLADAILGTDYSPRTREMYLDNFKRMGFVDPANQSFSHAYDRRQRKMRYFDQPNAWADGWTGAFMHAWAPEYIEELYPAQREWHLPAFFDRNLRGMPASAPEATAGMGYFAVYSAEMGDTEAVNLMLQFADTHLSPVWEQGRYYYPRNDDKSVDANGISPISSALQGNALLPFARLLSGNGLWRLHNQPWRNEQRSQPEVTGVDYSAAGVSEAYFDRSEKKLHIAFEPGPSVQSLTSFEVTGFDPRVPVELLHVGDTALTLNPGTTSGRAARSADGTLRIEFHPRRTASFVLRSAT